MSPMVGIIGSGSTPNFYDGSSAYSISAAPVNQIPQIVVPNRVKEVPLCPKTPRGGHLFGDPVVVFEEKPFYCLGSFASFQKVENTCACGFVHRTARLYLGEIYINGEWPEDLP